jgi:carboxylesterase type B
VFPKTNASLDVTSTTARTTTTTAQPLEDPIVELELGNVFGARMSSRGGREYLAFQGIPYAKPPLGELRFQSPVEPEAWNGTLNGTKFRPDCIQRDKYNPEVVTKGDEDCLYINVYTPKALADIKKRFDFRKFPVMVYIHGGGQFGSATRYGAEYFMDEDVVLVTLHYRLGVLGNLNTNDSNARGNQGLKDQVMALQWVKDNIKKFGGSSRKVTIFGNSYGGMEVTSHLLSPMSNGLFQRAISQSGTVLLPHIFTQHPLESANELARELNCTGNSTAEIVACFRKTDAKILMLTSVRMNFAFSVDAPSENTDDVFFPDTPLNLLQSGQMNRVAAIFGGTSGEGLTTSLPVLTNPNTTKEVDQNWTAWAIPTLSLDKPPGLKDPERIANEAREFYLGTKNLSREIEQNLTDMISDRNFFHPANVFATFLKNSGSGRRGRGRNQNVYLYYFNEKADKSYADGVIGPYGANDTFLGAGHADELQFFFPYDPYPSVPLGSQHANFSKMLIRLWVSFANTGKPTGTDNNVEWLPIEKEKPYRWFELKAEPQIIDFLGDRMNFWDKFNLTDLYT